MTATIGARTTHQKRRESTAERLSVMSGVLEQLDADLATDPGGVLRSAVRTLVPLAVQMPEFDLTISSGSQPDVAVRLYRDESGLRAELVETRPPSPAPQPTVSPVVSELAELLRRGEVRPR
jgi:hypothetical protein